jgi:hypothetical protein
MKKYALYGKEHIVEGFTAQQRVEFENGKTVQEYAKNKGIIL